MPKLLTVWITTNWKILKEMGIPDHLTCLLRSLHAGQKATVRTGHGTTDWFQIGKGVRQGCILSPSLFNLYAYYIMRNAGLEEAQAGIKIARRNINNLRYTYDPILMAEIEELKSLLMKVKEENEKAGLKLSIETCIISYMKRVASPGSMHDTGCLGLLHWDYPEGGYGEGGGRRVQDGEHRYTCGGRYLAKLIQYCKV